MNYIKVGLAILFLLCLLDMPYGFYELVRFLAMVGFGVLTYDSYKNNDEKFTIIYLIEVSSIPISPSSAITRLEENDVDDQHRTGRKRTQGGC